MTAGTVDIKRCLGLIKQLQGKNQVLLQERDELRLHKQQSDQKLQDIQERYNELASKFENLANSQSSSQYVPIEDARDENQLPEQLNHVLVDNDHVKELEDLLEQKNNEIVLLRQNVQKLNQDASQMANLKSYLEETKMLSTSYLAQLQKLQGRLNGFRVDCQETKHPQEVSGDQYAVTSPNTESYKGLQKELDKVKAENEELVSRLQPLQNVQAERDTISAQKNDLEEENKRLQAEISILATAQVADFPIESQIKVFLDDFHDERKEKEQQYREKKEIFEENQKLVSENQRLKEKLESVSCSMTDLQQKMAEWSPPQPHPSNPTKVTYDRGGASSRYDFALSPPVQQYHGAYYESSINYDSHAHLSRPAGYHSGPAPLNFTPTPSEPPRIGFPPTDNSSRVPASPPVPSNHSNFAPGMRPPLVSRQLAQDPRQPQYRPVYYMPAQPDMNPSGEGRIVRSPPEGSK